MRLGEMLVRDRHISPDQLESAIAEQQRSGGRLGTVLVELGLIDLDALTVYLGIELGVPIATGAALERAKRNAVRQLPAGLAARFRCIPLLAQDRQLIAAIDDPHDLEALVELSRATGHRVVPRVAPEIRIFYYLERYYGVVRPPRFLRFGDSPRGSRRSPSAPNLPAPPLPGLPPEKSEPVRAPTPSPVLPPPARKRDPAHPDAAAPAAPRPTPGPAAPAAALEAVELEAEDLLVELEADDEATAEQAEPTQVSVQPAPAAPAPETFEPLDVEDAIGRLRTVTQRGEVAEALMSYAAGFFHTAVLCIVRDNMAFGWKGFGPGLDRERLETLLIPLDAPSIFQSAIAGDGFFHGPPVPGTLHNHLYKVLRCEAPANAAVAVIKIGPRIVNILYGHREDGVALSEIDLDGLHQIGAVAAGAYVRIIKMAKRATTEDGVGAGAAGAPPAEAPPDGDGDGASAGPDDDEAADGAEAGGDEDADEEPTDPDRPSAVAAEATKGKRRRKRKRG